KVRVLGHPLHPILVAFPIAFAVGTVVSDSVAAWLRSPNWYFTGLVLTVGAWSSGLLAALPGVVDYRKIVPVTGPARRIAAAHMLLNFCIVLLFFIAWRIKA